jgi:hypothetical protein
MARRDSEDDPKRQLIQGLGLLWKAARGATSKIQHKVEKTDVGRSIDDAGRELGRALGRVAERVEKEIRGFEPTRPGHEGEQAHGTSTTAEPDDGSWPTTREEYEAKFGPVMGDWPRSAEEYEKRYGHKPGKKPKGPTPDDPGFRIM